MSKHNPNEFFVLTKMIDNGGEDISFEKDLVFPSLLKTVDHIKVDLPATIHKFVEAGDMVEDIGIPTNEDIYFSLFEDSYMRYIIGNQDIPKCGDIIIVYHVTKLTVAPPALTTAEMDMIQE